jgi:hypothetical protein
MSVKGICEVREGIEQLQIGVKIDLENFGQELGGIRSSWSRRRSKINLLKRIGSALGSQNLGLQSQEKCQNEKLRYIIEIQ